MTCERESTKERAEIIFLFSIKIDLKLFSIVHRTKVCFAVFWLKVVMIVRDIAQYIYRPSSVGRPRKIGLIIQKVGVILTGGF